MGVVTWWGLCVAFWWWFALIGGWLIWLVVGGFWFEFWLLLLIVGLVFAFGVFGFVFCCMFLVFFVGVWCFDLVF